MIDRQELARRIENAFAVGGLLPATPVLRHGSECLDCSMMAAELSRWVRVSIDREGVIVLAGMQRHLTPDGWLWFVSNFLRHMVADEYLSNHVEIESLVYFLSPTHQEADQVREVLGKLSGAQLETLVTFHLWLAANDFWQTYAGMDIDAAITFLGETQRSTK